MTGIIRCPCQKTVARNLTNALWSNWQESILIDVGQCRGSANTHTSLDFCFRGRNAMTRFDDGATLKTHGQSVLAPESTPWILFPMRCAEYRNRRNAAGDPLGPHPDQTVETFRDLGLSDDEIARYFGLSLWRIKRLSDGSQRSDRSGSLCEVANLVRAKLFCGAI